MSDQLVRNPPVCEPGTTQFDRELGLRPCCDANGFDCRLRKRPVLDSTEDELVKRRWSPRA